jgi:hypothetical protein
MVKQTEVSIMLLSGSREDHIVGVGSISVHLILPLLVMLL